MQTPGSWVDAVESTIGSVSTTETRLALTAGILLGIFVVGWVLLPRVVAALDRSLRDRVDGGFFDATLTAVGRYTPASGRQVVAGTFKLSLVVAGAFGLGVLWGATDTLLAGWGLVAGKLPENTARVAGQLGVSLVVAFLAYVGTAALTDIVDDFSERAEWMTDHQEEILLRVSQLSLLVVVGVVVLGVWGVNLAGLLVGAGFLGIVVGLAARQTLGSLIAGFVLMFSRPFTIGDWVQVGDAEGIVTDITIFNTRLENFDGEYVIIPNDRVADRAIVNRSQKGLLRIRIDVGIDYEADPDHARSVALDAIGDCKEVVDAPPPQVFPKSFGDSAVVLEMRFWIDHPTPPRKWKAVSAVITAVKSAFEDEAIKIPFPQRELSGRAETGGFQVRDSVADAAGEPAPEPETD